MGSPAGYPEWLSPEATDKLERHPLHLLTDHVEYSCKTNKDGDISNGAMICAHAAYEKGESTELKKTDDFKQRRVSASAAPKKRPALAMLKDDITATEEFNAAMELISGVLERDVRLDVLTSETLPTVSILQKMLDSPSDAEKSVKLSEMVDYHHAMLVKGVSFHWHLDEDGVLRCVACNEIFNKQNLPPEDFDEMPPLRLY
jgi:hypothetical protein